MACVIGHVPEFKEGMGWRNYCERMEQFFVANGITDSDRKRAILLATVVHVPFKEKCGSFKVNVVDVTGSEATQLDSVWSVYSIGGGVKPFKTEVLINGDPVSMDIDSGAGYSMIPLSTYRAASKSYNDISPCDLMLSSYTGENIPLVGKVVVTAEIGGHILNNIPLIITKQNGPALLGRNWMTSFGMTIKHINNVSTVSDVSAADFNKADFNKLLKDYSDVFTEELGKFTGPKAHIYVDKDVPPIYCKARAVREVANDLEVEPQAEPSTHDGTPGREGATPSICLRRSDRVRKKPDRLEYK
ncbi:hypothetical protein GQR58_014135 [Nymphon striatum]|nr:hypothetical protein GQR58_014135 [Nymphon striatum]